ncbi:hypothetical protein [Streptomyces tanashiensis]|uniref:hypothetical protein n=1 Tax=Streptomyces tanashiensis TaxID=67367 RepID=UPI00167CEDD3|nr:hypothetical protein [Streptomyces tanashiensis]
MDRYPSRSPLIAMSLKRQEPIRREAVSDQPSASPRADEEHSLDGLARDVLERRACIGADAARLCALRCSQETGAAAHIVDDADRYTQTGPDLAAGAPAIAQWRPFARARVVAPNDGPNPQRTRGAGKRTCRPAVPVTGAIPNASRRLATRRLPWTATPKVALAGLRNGMNPPGIT